MTTDFSPPADLPATVEPCAVRQSDRLDNIPAVYRTTHERLACELSLKMEDPEVIFSRYGYTPDQAAALVEQPAFTVMLDRISKEIQASGLSFKTKAKAIAEDLLPHAYEMATDPLCSSAVRADIIKWAAKISGYEPSGKDEGKGGGGGGLTLSITFAGQAPQQVVTHQPLTIEGERA